jgi:hypothetical protein
VTCFKRHVSDVAFVGQVWNFTGNRLVEVHINSNAEVIETGTLEAGASFAVYP